MGNKKKTARERYNIDPRTNNRRREQTNIAVTRSSESSLTQPTTNNMEENTTISLSCAPSSSSSMETSILPAKGAITASEKKFKKSEWQPPSTSTDTDRGGVESIVDDDIVDDGHQSAYVFMDTNILSSLLNELIKCTRCGLNVETSLLIGNKQGLCHYFNIKCRNISCRWSKCFSTSKDVEGWSWGQTI